MIFLSLFSCTCVVRIYMTKLQHCLPICIFSLIILLLFQTSKLNYVSPPCIVIFSFIYCAKQGHYWYHFYNVFGMTRSLTGDYTGTSRTRSQHSTTRLSRRRYALSFITLVFHPSKFQW